MGYIKIRTTEAYTIKPFDPTMQKTPSITSFLLVTSASADIAEMDGIYKV